MGARIDSYMLDRNTSEMRYRCRRCRGKLPEPTDNERKGFCTKGCWEQYHWTRCIVCEKAIEQPKNGVRRWLCKRPKCRSALKRLPHVYRPFEQPSYPHSQDATHSLENAHSTGLESRLDNDRPWLKRPWRHVAGPRLSPESFAAATSFDKFTWASFERTERQNRDLIREACSNPDAIFQRETPPVNLLGGYKFPAAPKLDPDLVKNIEEGIDPAPSFNVDRLLADDGHPSDIPAFLRREAI
jgi:hypothetical protein